MWTRLWATDCRHRKILLKSPYSKRITKVVDGIYDAFLSAVRKQDDDHKTTTSEEQRKQTFTGRTVTFYCVHLNNIKIRESSCVLFEVNVGTFVAVYLLNIFLTRLSSLFALLVSYASGKINVPCCKDTLVKVVIECSAANRDLICVDSEYVA